MCECASPGRPSITVTSPIRGKDVIDTFTAARLLFPQSPITKAQRRLVQRLCSFGQLEAYKIGRKYHIVLQSIHDYLEENHYGGPANHTMD